MKSSKKNAGKWDTFYSISSIPEKVTSETQLPYTSLNIDYYSFEQLWRIFSDLLYNPSNPNVVTLILDNSGTIQSGFLLSNHKGKASNQFFSKKIIISKENINKLKDSDDVKIENIESTFNFIKNYIFQNHNIDIGNLLIIPEDIFKKLQENEEKRIGANNNLILQEIGEILDLFVDFNMLASPKHQFQCHPEPLLLQFLRNLKLHYGVKSFYSFAQTLHEFLPKKAQISLSLKNHPWCVTYKITPEVVQLIKIPERFLENCNGIYSDSKILKYLRWKEKIPHNFIVDISKFKPIIKEITQSQYPLDNNRFNFLLQIILNMYRSIGGGKMWNCYPKSFNFIGGQRYNEYSAGFRFNQRKISNWSLPEIILQVVNEDFGLSGTDLLVFGKLKDQKSDHSFVKIKRENGNLRKIEHLNETESVHITQQYMENSDLEDFRISLIPLDENMYFDHIIWIGYPIIEEIFKYFVMDYHNWGYAYFKVKKIIKIFKNPDVFSISPMPAHYSHFMNTSLSKFVKNIGAIMTDLYEF